VVVIRSRYHATLCRAATLFAVTAVLAAPVHAIERFAGDLILEEQLPLGKPAQTKTFAPSVEYSNVANFLGEGFVSGGSALQGANRITRLIADDITPTGANAGASVIQFKFTMANFNGVAVTVRPRVRFWFDNGGIPGAYYNLPTNVGFTFSPILLNAASAGVYTTNLALGSFTMPGTTFWAGMTFDDADGTTGITPAQLDLVGQAVFSPPTVGSSEDVFFLTNAAGSFFGTNHPAGTLNTFTGSPPSNLGWEFTADDATPAQRSTWGRIRNLYK
jgi:hypothetical protein